MTVEALASPVPAILNPRFLPFSGSSSCFLVFAAPFGRVIVVVHRPPLSAAITAKATAVIVILAIVKCPYPMSLNIIVVFTVTQ